MGTQIIAPLPETDPAAFIDLSDEATQAQPYLLDCWSNTCENHSTCGCACDNGV